MRPAYRSHTAAHVPNISMANQPMKTIEKERAPDGVPSCGYLFAFNLCFSYFETLVHDEPDHIVELNEMVCCILHHLHCYLSQQDFAQRSLFKA